MPPWYIWPIIGVVTLVLVAFVYWANSFLDQFDINQKEKS